MLSEYYQTKQRKASKRLVKGINIFPNERKIKSINKLANDIEIFQKERKIKSKNMVANDIKIFLKMRNKRSLSIGKVILNRVKIKPLFR